MSRKYKSKSITKLLIISSVPVLLIGVGIAGTIYYQNYLENKIYSVGETMKYPDFSVDITKAEVKPVNLPISENLVEEHGGLEIEEDCSTFSDTPRQEASIEGPIDDPSVITPYIPSDRVYCVRRNNSRADIEKYSEKNKQLVIDYKITTKDGVDTSRINIELLPDSGRQLDERVNQFNGNEFMEDNDFSHEVITSMVKYMPYYKSDIGGNIGKGLTRTGYLYTDVRNSEDVVDFILSYKQNDKTHSRTMRIDLN